MAIILFFSLGVLLSARNIPLRDKRPLPNPARLSFIIFALALILAGLALILKLPNIIPWPLIPESSVMFGWMFLGAASTYVYAALKPFWNFARGPLLGFLVYDLVLGLPLIGHLADVKPENQLSLILYLIIVIYSVLLGIYYLFINRQTRSWSLPETA